MIKAEYVSRGRGRGGYKSERVAPFFQGRAMALQNSCARPWLLPMCSLTLHFSCPCLTSPSSLLFLQVDNKPCVQQQESSCFPSAPGAARFLRARMAPGRPPSARLEAVIQVRGVMEELGDRSEERVEIKPDGKPGEKTDGTSQIQFH